MMLRMEGRQFFVSAERVANFLWSQFELPKPEVLLLTAAP